MALAELSPSQFAARAGEAAALLKQLRLYATSVSVLQGFDDQAIFLSSYEFLKKQLHERAASVRDNAG